MEGILHGLSLKAKVAFLFLFTAADAAETKLFECSHQHLLFSKILHAKSRLQS